MIFIFTYHYLNGVVLKLKVETGLFFDKMLNVKSYSFPFSKTGGEEKNTLVFS
jgi:hypothetical protein